MFVCARLATWNFCLVGLLLGVLFSSEFRLAKQHVTEYLWHLCEATRQCERKLKKIGRIRLTKSIEGMKWYLRLTAGENVFEMFEMF